uniref:Conserved plasma membrane protein n=2 Tax=Macrostomum lignano TaxID=282301 RepID=A0A1I8HPR4_9PLAT
CALSSSKVCFSEFLAQQTFSTVRHLNNERKANNSGSAELKTFSANFRDLVVSSRRESPSSRMRSCSVLLLLILVVTFLTYADSSLCTVFIRGKRANVTCKKPDPYCCRLSSGASYYYCCDDCDQSTESDDCGSSNYWKYLGYAVSGLALLVAMAGLSCCLAKAVKSACCKHRSSVGDSTATRAARGSPDYPRNDAGPAPELQQPAAKPPGYYELFPVSPPPAYEAERPENA